MNELVFPVVIGALLFIIFIYVQNIITERKTKERGIKNIIKNHRTALKKTFQSEGIQQKGTEKTKTDTSSVNLNIMNMKVKEGDSFFNKLWIRYIYVNTTGSRKKLFIEYLIFAMIIMSACFFGAAFSMVISFIIGLLISVPIIIIKINRSYNKKISRFLDNFVSALDIISRGVRTGLMLNDCFNLIVEETDSTVSEQFRILLRDMRVGMEISQIMERFSNRLPLKEVRFFGIVLAIQAKTGGNLSHIINKLAIVLRKRKEILMKVKILSQEAKTTAKIMMALPFFVLGAISLMEPEYVDPLFNNTLGLMIFGGGVVWMAIGLFVMNKMINFVK